MHTNIYCLKAIAGLSQPLQVQVSDTTMLNKVLQPVTKKISLKEVEHFVRRRKVWL